MVIKEIPRAYKPGKNPDLKPKKELPVVKVYHEQDR